MSGPYAIKQGANLFQPTVIPGCQLWLDGADPNSNGSVPTNGATVSTWVDKSGLRNNGTGVNNPTYQNNGVFFNYSSGQYYTLPDGTLPFNNSSYSYFIICRFSVANGKFGLIGGGSYGVGNGVTAIRSDDTLATASIETYWWANDFTTSANTVVANVSMMVGSFYDAGVSRNMYINGTLNGTGGLGTRAQTNNNNTVAKTYAGEYMNGYIYEVIVYNTRLSITQQQQIEGYLAWKWGLQGSLPSTHPYKSSPVLTNLPYTSNPRVPYTFNNPVFVPIQISGCLLWLDAGDASSIIASGSSLSTWRDKSGNGYNATQPTSGNRPTYATNTAVQYRAANTQYLGLPQTFGNAMGNTAFTIFFVMQRVTNGSHFPMAGSNTSADNLLLVVAGFTTVSMSTYGVASLTGNINSYTVGEPYMILTFQYTGPSTNIGYIYQNGNLIVSNIVALGLTSYGGPQLGSSYSGGNRAYSDINQSEVIVYNTSLTTQQRQQVEGYLAWKWGLTSYLSSANPYRTAPIAPFPYVIRKAGQNKWQPTQVSGMTLWLDGADPNGTGVVPTNGSSISSWVDKSGNGLTVSAASSLPTYSTNVLNKLGTLAFDGTQSLNAGSVTGSKLIANNNACAVFCVFSVTNNTQNSCPFTWDDNTYTYRFMMTWAGGEGTAGLQMDVGNFPYRTQITTSNFNFTNNQYYLVSYQQNGISTIMKINGQAYPNYYATSWSAWSASASRIFYVGAYGNQSVYNMKGSIAEILFYNTNIPSNFQQVEGYLAWKWGLQGSLPATHPYKLFPPSP